MWCTVHVNHTKPAKLTAPDLPEPVPAPETPRPAFGYLPSGLLGRRTHPPPPPPAAAAPTKGLSLSTTAAVPALRPSVPTASEMPPPATMPTNQKTEPAVRPRRSPRLNPGLDRVCAIKGPPGNLPFQSQTSSNMARTYPLFVS